MSLEHRSPLLLEDEPSGPFRFSVRQLQPEELEVDPPNTNLNFMVYNDLFDVQLCLCETRLTAEGRVEPFNSSRHRFFSRRTDFLRRFFEMEINTVLLLEGVGVSDAGIQQIFSYTLVQAQAIANNQLNSNQDIISMILFLERLTWLRDDNRDLLDIALAHVIEESMHYTTYNFVPATKSSIEALEKFRLKDGSFASKELCMICLEQLSFTMEVTRMPCSHLYHGDCIVQWLNTSHLCPFCRFPMPCVN